MLRRLTSVRVLLPVIVGVGLLAYVVSIALAPQSSDQFAGIVQATWWIVLLLTVPYLTLRALVWRRLLDQLGIHLPWKPVLVAFAGGEMSKTLPAGIYVQNYLLARLKHIGEEGVARASMASTAMLGLEAALAVPVGLTLGWPGDPWVRWLILGVIGVWIAVLAAAWGLVHYGAHHLPQWAPGAVRTVVPFLEDFFEAGGELLTWRTARLLVPTALYMLAYATDLYAIAHAAGRADLTFPMAVGIQAFTVMTVILVPVPTEIGLTEFTGLQALVAYAVPEATAAVVILAMRALATGMTIVVAALVLIWLRGEWLRQRDKDGAEPDLREHASHEPADEAERRSSPRAESA